MAWTCISSVAWPDGPDLILEDEQTSDRHMRHAACGIQAGRESVDVNPSIVLDVNPEVRAGRESGRSVRT